MASTLQFTKINFVLTLFLILIGLTSADWLSSQLTDNDYAESMPSVDLDSFDNPHFVWCSNNDGDYDIYYLSEITGMPVKVTDNSTQDLYPCLRLDQAGNAHIGFKGYDGHDYEEYYVNNIGGNFGDPIQVSFTSTNVGVFVPERSCLAIDSMGIAHIVYKYGYYEYGNWDVYYVNNEGGSFGPPTRITDGAGAINYVRPSIALDTADFIHIVFEGGTNIIYTNNAMGSFDTLKIVSEGAYRWHASLGIDSSNKVHISYAGYHGGVYYINNVSGVFDSTIVLSEDNSVNGPTALAVDHLDDIHIAYIGGVFGNTNSHELYYVYDSAGSFGDPEQITNNNEHTTDISLRIDSLDACHIAFLEGLYGSNDYEVWYTTNSEYGGICFNVNRFKSINPSYLLLQNYPNPFNSTTQIGYALSKQAKVVLSIYNILGEKVVILVDKHQPPGHYTVEWKGKDANSKQLPNGVYFCRFINNGNFATKKMILDR